jgi:quinol monooxygenase YgiN
MKSIHRTMMKLRNPVPSVLSSFHPSFRLTSFDPVVAPLMQDILDRAALQSGIDDFGWTRSGEKLFWRSAFDDSDSMFAAFLAMRSSMNNLIRAGAEMDRIEFVAPSSSLARIREESEINLRAFKPEYFESEDAYQTGYFRKLPITNGSRKTLCTLTPQYTIQDWDKARPIMQKIIDSAYTEPGCTYFGWSKSGKKLNSREMFTDGKSLKAHLEKVIPLIEELKAGPATLDKIEVHGPDLEIKEIEQTAAGLGPEYFKAEGSPKEKLEGAAEDQEDKSA